MQQTMAEISINSRQPSAVSLDETNVSGENNLDFTKISIPLGANPPREGNNLFPIFLKLEKFRLLIVGGGFVGLEKLSTVLANSPNTCITLVGREISNDIRELAAAYKKVTLHEKVFEPTDIVGHDFIIAATDDKKVNTQIKRLAEEQRILCNVADTPHECDFYLSSIVQKGQLKIAISTNGKSPTVAKRLREMLTETLPDKELNEILTNMGIIRQKIGGDFANKVVELNKLTNVLVEDKLEEEVEITKPRISKWKFLAIISLIAFCILLIVNFVALYSYQKGVHEFVNSLDKNFRWYILTGFIAEFVAGLLGLGYGVTTSIALMTMNIPPVVMGSSIHTAELFSMAASGYSHYKFGNINKKLLRALILPGIIGAIFGAMALVYFGEHYGAWIKPLLAIYAAVLGINILSKVFKKKVMRQKVKNIGYLATAGGFIDSFGGGGWGPLITSTLVSKGRTPRYVVGTVNASKFFVAFASALTFFFMVGIGHWQIIIGIMMGGFVAAPVSARLAGLLPTRTMYIAVGVMIIIWSVYILQKLIF